MVSKPANLLNLLNTGLFENANRTRNLLEYDGSFMMSEMEMEELIRATRNLQEEAALMYRQWKQAQR